MSSTEEDVEDVEDKNSALAPRLRLIYPSEISSIFSTEDSEVHSSFSYIGTQGKKVTFLDRDSFYNNQNLKELKALSFRSNLIRDISGLSFLPNPQLLITLELYENLLTNNEAFNESLKQLVNLGTLDLSYNRLRYIPDLSLNKRLKKVYLAQNKISVIEHLDACESLEMLDLGMNRIERIQNLEKLKNLRELWLGKNKIKLVEGVRGLHKLERLDIQSNRLTHLLTPNTRENTEKILPQGEREKLRFEESHSHAHSHEGSHGHSHDHREHEPEFTQPSEKSAEAKVPESKLDLNEEDYYSEFTFLPQLKELYLSHQGIFSAKGLSSLVHLTILDLTANKMSSLEDFKDYSFQELEDLWLGENNISDFKQIENLSHLKNLTTLYLEQNPLAKEYDYRIRLAAIIPSLTQIDASII